MEDLNLLSLIEDASVQTLQNLPSWVPDYSTAPQTHPLIGSLRATVGWNVSDGLRWEVPLQADLLSLLVKGIYFDTIEFAAGAERITEAQWITDHRHMKTLLDLLAHSPQPRYPGGGTPIEAFWRTLIKDTFRGRPADEEARGAFQMFIALRVWELEEAFKNLRGSPSELPSKDLDELSIIYSQTKAAILDLSTRYPDGIIPNWNTIKRLIEIGQDKTLPEKKDLNRDSDYIEESFRAGYNGRRLLRARGNYIGIASQSLQEDDAVWVLAGTATPMVSRHLPNGNWKYVGEAYVHDIMNGEAVRGDDVKLERICLE